MMGGSAWQPMSSKRWGRQLEGKLPPGDSEWREATNEYVRQNNASGER